MYSRTVFCLFGDALRLLQERRQILLQSQMMSCITMDISSIDSDSFVFDHDSPNWSHAFIHLITLNIRNGTNSNLNVVLRAMHQMQIDLGILTETKIMNDMYT
jgi:hypothetical protein